MDKENLSLVQSLVNGIPSFCVFCWQQEQLQYAGHVASRLVTNGKHFSSRRVKSHWHVEGVGGVEQPRIGGGTTLIF